MKNLMIAAVLALGTMTAFAQETETAIEDAENAVEETATDAASAAEEAAEETYGEAEEAAEEAADATENAAEEAVEGTEEAAEEVAEGTEEAVEETEAAAEEVAEETEEATEAVEESAEEASEEMAQDNFSEVAVEDVPEAITTALEEAHPGATVSKAHMNDQGQYKLEVTKEDGETAELYMDAEGNQIEM